MTQNDRMREPAHRGWLLLLGGYLLLLGAVIAAAYLDWLPRGVVTFPYYDTVGHFLLIGGAAMLLELALHGRKARVPLPGGGAWIISASFLIVGSAASVEELLQFFSHHRRFEWLDLLANLAGALSFTWGAEFLLTERQRHHSFAAFVRRSTSDLAQFVVKLALASLFPVAIFASLALTRELSFPVLGIHRYDLLLLIFLGIQALLWVLKVESAAELKTITWFHLLGLALELFKVQAGSWSYPEPAWTKLYGVPLYSGFMYASVASFLIAIWHRLRIRLEGWPPGSLVALLGIAIYLNFFTHHFVTDLRWFLILGVLFLFLRTRLVVVNTDKARHVPLVASFLGLGFFIWVAENIATYFGAWAYPDQLEGWRMVHLAKINSWFLLGIISFMLVAQLQLKRRER